MEERPVPREQSREIDPQRDRGWIDFADARDERTDQRCHTAHEELQNRYELHDRSFRQIDWLVENEPAYTLHLYRREARDLEASINTSEFYQGGPRLGRFGGRQKSALDASLLCVLSGHADWSEFMSVDTSADPANVTLGGSAEICGSIGKCPFCLSKCAGITVKGVLSTGGINYFIDY